MNELSHELPGGAVALQDLLRHGSWIRGFCRSLVGSADGDDLAQETWLVALRRADRTGPIGRPRPWLASVARRLAFDRWKRPAGASASLEAPEAVPDGSAQGVEAAEIVQQSELAHVVAGEILALAEPNRSTLLLRYFEGLDASEIATRVGVPAATVRSRIRRGLEDVREALDRRHGGDRSRWLAALAPIVVPVNPRPTWLAAATLTLAAASAVFALAAWQGRGETRGVVAGERSGPVGEPEVAARLQLRGDPESESARQPIEAPPAAATSATLVAPRVRWHHPVGQNPSPLVVGERIVSVGQELACLSTEDGSVIWKLAEGSSWWSGPPAFDEGRLYVAHTTGGVACFALADGRTLWRRPYEEVSGSGHPCAIVRCADGAVCLIGTKSGVTALSADDGSVLWEADLGSSVELRPASDGKVVLVGTRAGTFAALALTTGELVWKHEGGSQYGWSNPVIAEGVGYVADRGKGGSARRADGGKLTIEVAGNRGGALNAFDLGRGELLWGRIFGSTGFSEPFVTETDVWGGFGSVVLPFKREDGSVTEERVFRTGRNAFGSPRVLGDRLIFGNLDGHLYVHDVETTELVWKFAPLAEGECQVGGWTAAHGRLYVSTSEGLFALEDPPGAEPVAAGTRIVPEPTAGEPDGQAADLAVVEAPVFESAAQIAAAWSERIAPRDESGTIDEARIDPLQSAAAMDEVRDALESPSTARVHAALMTIARIQEVQDVTGLRWLVEPHARAGEPALRVSALYALWAVGPAAGGTRADDLALVHAAWDVVAADSRLKLPHLMSMFGENVIEGRSEELVMSLLAEPSASLREWINGLWGARVSDRVALRLVELATDSVYESQAYDAFYYALSTWQEKQPAVVEVLLDALAHPDPNWSRRAAWGLSFGVPEAQQASVVDAILARWDGLAEPVRRKVADLVRDYGTREQIDALGE